MPGGSDPERHVATLPTAALDVGRILGRRRRLFADDVHCWQQQLDDAIADRSFLVLGGAGSIGRRVVEQLFARRPARLHVVDLSENGLAELVRNLRSTFGYLYGESRTRGFLTLALDIGDPEYAAFFARSAPYDHVLNLAAMKHVRSERDPYTLLRMVHTNVACTATSLDAAIASGCGHFFAVSTDKAVAPANAMGASKRIMELCLSAAGDEIGVSSTRFANVAFSDGSLLDSFTRRLALRQPLAAPDDVLRYFITADEAADLCLMACLLGGQRECFVPAPADDFQPTGFRDIAERLLAAHGLRAHPCDNEDEARSRVDELAAEGAWPCLFTPGDTTGEKHLEEFRRADEELDTERFGEIGVVRWPLLADRSGLDRFLDAMGSLRRAGDWSRRDVLGPMMDLVPDFRHRETGSFLDGRM